jgi:hypothetical protein
MIVTTEKRKPGRPCIRNWSEEAETIRLLIRSGYGLLPLAGYYGISGPGMRKVLARLGIRTVYQAAKEENKGGGDGTS